MTNVIEYKEKWILLMRSGMIHWVSKETGERAAEVIAAQNAHQFLRIKELGGIAVNTADMEGAYTHKQYEDLSRVKGGEWQCAYGAWHKKRGDCQCKQEYHRDIERRRLQVQEDLANKPLTESERAEVAQAILRTNERMALGGLMFAREKFMKEPGIRRSTIKEWESDTGEKANTKDLVINEKA
jgi:hypothetical protein